MMIRLDRSLTVGCSLVVEMVKPSCSSGTGFQINLYKLGSLVESYGEPLHALTIWAPIPI